MIFFEKILYFLQGKMFRPTPFGWFHIMWILLSIISIFILFKKRKHYNDKQLKVVLGIYGMVSLVLEILKQLIWSFNYDGNVVIWDYQWYAAPFQLCTTPIFVSLISLFLKKGKLRDSLLSYMAYITILGSISVILLPDSCFVNDILVNIHTMWLHMGSFVVSIYLFISHEVKVNLKSLKNAYIVFLIFLFIAFFLNIFIYNLGVLNGETFNMFYISPYFVTTLPVFNVIQENVPYLIFLLAYILSTFIASSVVYLIAKLVKKRVNYKRNFNKFKTSI